MVSLPQPGQQYNSGESASARTAVQQWWVCLSQDNSTSMVSLPQPGQEHIKGESASARTAVQQWWVCLSQDSSTAMVSLPHSGQQYTIGESRQHTLHVFTSLYHTRQQQSVSDILKHN